MSTDQRTRDAIACWTGQFDDLLALERQALRITVDFDNGLLAGDMPVNARCSLETAIDHLDGFDRAMARSASQGGHAE